MAVALITGCSSGFGLHTAVELARRGHSVTATMRDPGRADGLLAAADEAGVVVDVARLDVEDPDSISATVGDVVARHGRLDVVVNNAGWEIRGPVEAISDAEARAQFDTNVFGLLNVVRATVDHLRASDDGVMVNVSSISGEIARPFAGIYAASKHAVEAISEALYFELGLSGVRVHVVQPGQFPTSLHENIRHAAGLADRDDEVYATYRRVAETVEIRAKALAAGGGSPDPGDVARAIAAVVAAADSPMRVAVGADAELILAARQSSTFEEYEVLMRTALDLWEGHRGDDR